MKIKQLIAGGAVILSMLYVQPVSAEEVLYADSVGYIQCEEGYVNIRNSASIDGEVVGKIYNNGQVFVQDYLDGWMQIRSGNVEGFIKSDFVAVEGDAVAAISQQAAYKTAYVWPEVLIVRAEPREDSREIDRLYAGQEIEVVGKEGNWAKVCITLDSYGYVNEYYIDYRTYYGTAESLEEPVETFESQQSYQEETYEDYGATYDEVTQSGDEYNQEDPWEQNAAYYYSEEAYEDYTGIKDSYKEDYSYDYSEEDYSYDNAYNDYSNDYSEEDYSYEEDYSNDYTDDYSYEEDYTDDTSNDYTDDYSADNETSNYSSSGDGSYLSQYAQQYIGNPYVWGGTSLETGADCSGFTLAVLGANGIAVNGRTAADQAQGGTQISLDEAEAGDLIYYDNGSGVYHIAIYNGDGTVTHSSSSTTGVIVSDMNYSGNAAGAVRYW